MGRTIGSGDLPGWSVGPGSGVGTGSGVFSGSGTKIDLARVVGSVGDAADELKFWRFQKIAKKAPLYPHFITFF